MAKHSLRTSKRGKGRSDGKGATSDKAFKADRADMADRPTKPDVGLPVVVDAIDDVQERGAFAFGSCDKCGWRGPARRSRERARKDLRHHLEARPKHVDHVTLSELAPLSVTADARMPGGSRAAR